MLLLETGLTTPTHATSMLAGASHPGLDLPLLRVAQGRYDGDHSKVYTNDYFDPSYGLIVLGLTWFFGGDPVPSRVRTRLHRLDSAQLAVLAGVRSANSDWPETELAQEKVQLRHSSATRWPSWSRIGASPHKPE